MSSTTIQHSQKHAPPSGSDAAVVCRSIEKSFGEGQARVRVLRGTDFDAKAGEMTFLVGPSGCGKTTLISIIGAILSCDDGDIRVLGDDLRRMRNGRLAEFRLDNFGFIFQQFNLLPALNAAENAAIPLVARGYSTRKAERVASEMLDKLGLGEHTRKIPAQLSGGQQQRVAIARALVHSPRIVICDEPTASLDAASGQRVMELLRDAAMDHERAVIVVTHDDRIFRFADRIAHMADGTISTVEQGKAEHSKTAVAPEDTTP
ncbi:MAG: ABC transporter ATP-binding protein [Phycisphaerales bacterium]|nr:MAG: ABC transporter ATP-binding protein [Phycisphaerales bacterium]